MLKPTVVSTEGRAAALFVTLLVPFSGADPPRDESDSLDKDRFELIFTHSDTTEIVHLSGTTVTTYRSPQANRR